MKRLLLALAAVLFYAVPASAQLNCVIYNGVTYCGNGVVFTTPVFVTSQGFTSAAGTAADTFLVRDAANVLALKNGTTAQTFRVYFSTAASGSYNDVIATGNGSVKFANRGGTAFVLDWSSGAGPRFFASNGSTPTGIQIGALTFGTDNTYNIGSATGTDRPASVFPAAPAITAGSGTGITVNNKGELREVVYQITVDRTQFITAGVNHDVTLATLPAKTFIKHILADVTQTFACTATCTTSTLSMTVGSAAGGNQYLVSFDVDAATAQFGDAAAELGASLTEASIPTAIGSLGSWASTSPVSLRMTSGTGNLGTGAATNLSQGSVTFYITTQVMP